MRTSYFFNMINKYKNSKHIETLYKCMFILVTIVYLINILIRIFYFAESPAEYRDAAVFKVIDMMAKGENPYSPQWLNTSDNPPVLLDSGFIHIFPAVLFESLFHIPASLACWLTTLIYIALASIMMYKIVLSLTNSRTLSIAATCLQLPALRRYGILCSRPDIMATMLLLVIIYICIKERKTIDYVVISFISVLIIFLKIHYAVIIISVCLQIIYDMIYTKQIQDGLKKLTVFFFSGCFFLFLSIFLMSFFFPTHLPIWGVRIFNMIGDNVGNHGYQYQIVITKYIDLLKEYWYIAATLLIGLVDNLLSKKSKKIRMAGPIVFLSINAIVNSLALLFVGRHSGAGLWYFYYMLMPTMIIITIYSISNRKLLRYVQISILIIGSMMSTLRISIHTCRMDMSSVNKSYATVKEYESENMYLSCTLSNYSIMNDYYNYDYGDAVFLPNIDKIPQHILNRLPYVQDSLNRYYEYQETIVKMATEKEYSLIVIDSISKPSEAFSEAIHTNYHLLQSIDFRNETQYFSLEFWIPNDYFSPMLLPHYLEQ